MRGITLPVSCDCKSNNSLANVHRIFAQMFRIIQRVSGRCVHGKQCFKNSVNYPMRTMSSTNYDYDGKTKVSILNNNFEMGLMINAYSEVWIDLTSVNAKLLKWRNSV